MLKSFWRFRNLVSQLVLRDILLRYKGSIMGLIWSITTPLLMLLIYSFVFLNVFKARWSVMDASGEPINFALVLFLGLIIHGLLADVLTRSPGLILEHTNFVKKVVFPLEILPWVAILSAVFNFMISFVLLLAFVLFEMRAIPLNALFLPLILFPYFLLLLGISWILSALGVYLRDIQHMIGTMNILLMFLSPVFYTIDMLPVQLQSLVMLNPIAFPIEQSRAVLIYGNLPDFTVLFIYSGASLCIALSGYQFFQKIRSGFADVL